MTVQSSKAIESCSRRPPTTDGANRLPVGQTGIDQTIHVFLQIDIEGHRDGSDITSEPSADSEGAWNVQSGTGDQAELEQSGRGSKRLARSIFRFLTWIVLSGEAIDELGEMHSFVVEVIAAMNG